METTKEYNNVTFTIKDEITSGMSGKFTRTGNRDSEGNYKVKEINEYTPFVNSTDIDWQNATISKYPNTQIKNSGDLLNLINDIANDSSSESTGAQGVQGAQGVMGTQGFAGAQGFAGLQGANGIQGAKGTLGAQGFAGLQGANGIQGAKGTLGAQGFTGVQGANGIQGTKGTTGDKGIQGFAGTQGFAGVQGIQGPRGEAGTFETSQLESLQNRISALENAILNMYTKDEIDSLLENYELKP